MTVMTPTPSDAWYVRDRLGGLRRFAVAITVLNVLGHTVLGFEQSWAQPLVAVATAYSLELLLEAIEARLQRRPARFSGGWRRTVDFLLSAHISAMAVSMLLYANDRLAAVAFGAAVAIGSKAVLRIRCGQGRRHFMNPSNFGITVTLLLFPWVGIAPPYQFTAELGAVGDWLLPGLIVCTGTLLNWRFTRRLPLLTAWLAGFAAQAVVRHLLTGASLEAALVPMSGLAFLLFTFYMVTDPATTPADRRGQIIFGAAVAAVYGILMAAHIVFGLFFALTAVTALRVAIGLLPAGVLAWTRPLPAPTAVNVPAGVEALPARSALLPGSRR